MSLQSPVRAPSGLAGRIAALALAAGLGVVVGAATAPYWGVNDPAATESRAATSAPSSPPVNIPDGAALRANEARFEPVLTAGQHFALGYSPERVVVVAASSAQTGLPNASPRPLSP